MGIRITGGFLCGRQIPSPVGRDIRPTAARTREAVFNILRDKVEGSIFLDLYAGSGIMGLEAISRGASKVIQVELDRKRNRLLVDQAKGLEIDALQVFCGDAQKYLAALPDRSIDVVYMDPPFTQEYPNPGLHLRRVLREHGVAICERPSKCMPPWMDSADQHRPYGESTLSFFYN